MNKEEIVRKCIREIKGESFQQEDNLISDGWLSSFELIELIARLEKAIGCKICLQNLSPDSFDSVAAISEII